MELKCMCNVVVKENVGCQSLASSWISTPKVQLLFELE